MELNDDNTEQLKQGLVGKSGGSISKEKTFTNKQELLNQFDPHLKEQLLSHLWNIISYNPLRFYIAHSEHKQIIISSVKKEKLNSNDDNFNLSLSNEIHSLYPTKIIIEAIPVEVIRYEDPLGLSCENKYTIKFETQIEQQKIFTIGPNTIDEIVLQLHNRAFIVDQNKAIEALSGIILTMEKDNKVTLNKDVITPGFYLIDNEIKAYNTSHPNPSKDEITKCVKSLESLQQKFKNENIFPTILKWSMLAPFDYVLKQSNREWMPWIYAYGFPRTGKTTLGDLSCAIWGHYQDDNYKIPFTNVDTVAKLGEALSKSTYPLVINEAGFLSDESRHTNKNLIEMIKTAIEGTIARSKFVHKIIYTEIPSFCACIFTSNSAPSTDLGFMRRIIALPFTQKDEYSIMERIDFEKCLNESIKDDLKIVGNYVASYILNNQNLLLRDKKNWKDIAKTILCEMYKVADKEVPKWVDYMLENEAQLEDSKNDLDLILRAFLIQKINDSYNKYHKSIDPDSSLNGTNQPFEFRLEFCLNNHLIPFLSRNTNNEIIITSDLIQELKVNKINRISSLQEISTMFEGFEYGQKKIGKKNVKAAYGSKIQFLEFLGFD